MASGSSFCGAHELRHRCGGAALDRQRQILRLDPREQRLDVGRRDDDGWLRWLDPAEQRAHRGDAHHAVLCAMDEILRHVDADDLAAFVARRSAAEAGLDLRGDQQSVDGVLAHDRAGLAIVGGELDQAEHLARLRHHAGRPRQTARREPVGQDRLVLLRRRRELERGEVIGADILQTQHREVELGVERHDVDLRICLDVRQSIGPPRPCARPGSARRCRPRAGR